MSKINNFKQLVDRAMNLAGRAYMRPVIEKELLHYDILFCLDKHGFLETLTFQGGTALRLCYGGLRFSEDLDFAGGRDFTSSKLLNMKICLEKYIGERYGLEISVKEPKEMNQLPQYEEIKVDKWQVNIITSPENRDMPKQKIKIDVVNIPAYTRIPRPLEKNYEFLPDGYSDTLIMTESLDEIMADKIISFVSCQRYIRYRDIWDLRWLKQQGAKINPDYLVAKIRDYKENSYGEKLQNRLSNLESIIRGKEFSNEMTRFIPADVLEQTLDKERFIDFLVQENLSLFQEVARHL